MMSQLRMTASSSLLVSSPESSLSTSLISVTIGAHLCTVGDSPLDPIETLGSVPDRPLPYFGWGAIPDQYGRAWGADDGETPLPPDPELKDLPPLRPDWGPGRQR